MHWYQLTDNIDYRSDAKLRCYQRSDRYSRYQSYQQYKMDLAANQTQE